MTLAVASGGWPGDSLRAMGWITSASRGWSADLLSSSRRTFIRDPVMRYVLVFISLLTLLASDALVARDWPHWRGPSRDGVSTATRLPVSWGATCLSEAPTPAPPPAAAPAPGFGRGGRGRGGFG